MSQDMVVMFEGTIYEEGYGWVAQKVMRDKELSTQAKAIYAYICSLAGNPTNIGNRQAFPSVSLMKSELGIRSQDTFYKHMNQLKKKGYLIVEQEKGEKGRFKRNIYKIVAQPKPQPVENNTENTTNKPSPKKSTTVPKSNFSTTDKPTTENWNTNSNSFNSNSFNKDLDTKDTKLVNHNDDKIKQQEKYIEDAFYQNSDLIPERLAELLKTFSQTTEDAEIFYNIILTAKKNVERKYDIARIHLEDEPELLHEIIHTFSRSIRKIKQGKIDTNPRGYLYKSIHSCIETEFSDRIRFSNQKDSPIYQLSKSVWDEEDDTLDKIGIY